MNEPAAPINLFPFDTPVFGFGTAEYIVYTVEYTVDDNGDHIENDVELYRRTINFDEWE
jgi:hypothetical protein